jgi:hypothetical protein
MQNVTELLMLYVGNAKKYFHKTCQHFNYINVHLDRTMNVFRNNECFLYNVAHYVARTINFMTQIRQEFIIFMKFWITLRHVALQHPNLHFNVQYSRIYNFKTIIKFYKHAEKMRCKLHYM